MKLQSIRIQNYKSIQDETINIKEVDGGFTYALIGVNESGKSSILRAIALKEGLIKPVYSVDFKSDSEPISVKFNYLFNSEFPESLKNQLIEIKFPEELLSKVIIKQVSLEVSFDPIPSNTLKRSIELSLENDSCSDYTVKGTTITKKDAASTTVQDDLSLKKYLEENLKEYFFSISHKVIFWKSEAKYLISEAIVLDTFAIDPINTSIPLKNCFELAGIKLANIKKKITGLKSNPSERTNLTHKLQDTVTAHIKNIWPDHPVKINFAIDETHLSFLIEDEGVLYQSRTATQRSDGFRQFISFLLTISAQNNNEQLSNSLLLLDEPEVHLHPTGQENLREELINISRGRFNNIVFFATHSNYMIDKNHLDRCYRVVKENNHTTKIESLGNTKSSYAKVNYVVFNLATSDYHNELYGNLQEQAEKFNEREFEDYLKSKNVNQDRPYIKLAKGVPQKSYNVTLPTYIRNLIHHPENTNNQSFSQKELVESIELLKRLMI
jgi:predicted ATP-dependent endonuclease of OLD family